MIGKFNWGYIFAEIDRNLPDNATLLVDIRSIPITLMNFDVTDLSSFAWDDTILDEEIPNQETLYELSVGGLPSGGGGLDVVFIAGIGLVIGTPIAIAGGALIIKRRQGKKPF